MIGITPKILPNNSLHATRNGVSSSASRFTLVGTACLSSGRLGHITHPCILSSPFLFCVC